MASVVGPKTGMDGCGAGDHGSGRSNIELASETTRLLQKDGVAPSTPGNASGTGYGDGRMFSDGTKRGRGWYLFATSLFAVIVIVWVINRVGHSSLDPESESRFENVYQAAASPSADGAWSDAVTFDIKYDPVTDMYQAFGGISDSGSTSPAREGQQKLFASGRYTQDFHANGWHYLELENAPVVSDEDYIKGMKAVGVMEGFLTCNHTKLFYLNYMHGMFEGRLPLDSTVSFLRKNYNWARAKADALYTTDDYWLTVKGMLAQLEGMVEGHRLSCPCEEGSSTGEDVAGRLGGGGGGKCDGSLWTIDEPTIMHFLLLNANGDLYQINQKFTQSNDDRRARRLHPRSRHYDRVRSETALFDNEDGNGDGVATKQSPRDDSPSAANASAATTVHRQLRLPRKRTNHCSAVFKLLADKSDIVFGHNTWDTYESASPRAIKRFRLHSFERSQVLLRRWDPATPIYGDFEAFWDPHPAATTRATESSRWGDSSGGRKSRVQELLFSSSAGFLSSVDDFYITKGGHGHLAIIETSLDVYREPIISQIVPESMLYWMRVKAATALAVSGSEWALWFSLFHSGTYVNQWLVLDMALFRPGEADLRKGLFTVLEEMPGKAHIEDKSAHLSTYGYWASYNLPYFPEILRYSGASDLCDADPTLNCYSTDPRARIFRARQGNVTSVAALQDLMLYNDFEHDPLSLNDPCSAIACRQDLESNVWIRSPFGAIDAKVGSIASSMDKDDFPPLPSAATEKEEEKDMRQYGSTTKPRALRSRASGTGTLRTDEQSTSSHAPIKIWAKLGPSNAQQETFCWSTFWGGMGIWRETEKDYSHKGHPDCFDFSWQTFPHDPASAVGNDHQ